MASLVDTIAGNAAQRQDPFTADLSKSYSEGRQQAIALGGQYLQAKQLEAQIQMNKEKVQNEWQSREDAAWKTLYDQSAAGGDSKQIKNTANVINQIRKMRGNGSVMNDDQLDDLVSTYSANPDFGAKSAQLQSMMVDSISSGKPIDPNFAKLYQEIRQTPGIAASTRMKEIETSIGSYMTSRGQEMRSNVGQQGKSSQDVLNDTVKSLNEARDKYGKNPEDIVGSDVYARLKAATVSGAELSDQTKKDVQLAQSKLATAIPAAFSETRNYNESQKQAEDVNRVIKDISDKNVNADPKIQKAITDAQGDLSQAIKDKDPDKVRAVQNRMLGLQNRMGNPSWQQEQGNKYNDEVEKRQTALKKSLEPYDKINETLEDGMNRLQNALHSGASATETRQQVGTLVSTIENAKGQTNKYKMSLALPTTYGTDIKNWWNTKIVGKGSDFSPGEKEKYEKLYEDVKRAHVKAMDNVADQQASYGKNAKDKWSRDVWGPNGGNTQTVKEWKQGVHQRFGVPMGGQVRGSQYGTSPSAPKTKSNMITMPSGKQYTPDQVKQLLPKMTPDARQKWQEYLDKQGGQ